MNLRFPISINNGKLTFLNRETFIHAIEDLKGDYYLELHQTGVRSPEQNNYYWYCVELLSESTGSSKEEMHHAIKKHFKIEHTSLLTKKEFSRFIEDFVMWAADFHNCYMPDPHSVSNMNPNG